MNPANPQNPLVLIVLDGFGISMEKEGNALLAAKIPNFRYISENYPGTALKASGDEVGLAWGEMGSSEVGHTNIGAGLVVYQNLPKINLCIKNKSFFDFPIWKKAVEHATKNNSALHIIGLVSNGGVHSHIDHLHAILQTVKKLDFKGEVFVHAVTDGRDTAPKSTMRFIEPLEKELKKLKSARIASVAGRYYAMDRGENWDRTEKYYNCLIKGEGNKASSAEKAVEDSYNQDKKDEMIEPYVIVDKNQPIGRIKDNDAAIFFNFRADRARQLTRAFVLDDFDKFSREKLKNLLFITMTQYGIGVPLEAVFPPEYINQPLAKILSDAGKAQFHIAETEKYAHVTYFFNGGTEQQFPKEDRAIIPSKEVKSYDLAPEMSAYEITDRVLKELKKQKYDFIVMNFANCDMVGHTGNFKAGVKAVEVVDECVGKIYQEALKMGGVTMVTADHGNVEEMVNMKTKEISKEHTTNPVPLWIIAPDNKLKTKAGKRTDLTTQGILGDVTPTVLELMGIPPLPDMTGASLLGVIAACPLPE